MIRVGDTRQRPTAAERRGYARRWPLFGLVALFALTMLVVGATVGSIGVPARLASVLFDAAAAGAGIVNIFWLSHLVFDTRGRGHYVITKERLADAIFGHLLGQVAVSVALWKLGFAHRPSPVTMFTHTPPSVTMLYALYDLFVYTVLLLAGGGIVDNLPASEVARVVGALQCAYGVYVVVVILAAAVATLATHTDE